MEQRHRAFDISSARDILTILFKHKYIIIITFLIISISVTIFSFYSTRTKIYESKSVILVKFGREFMTRPEEGRSGQAIPQQAIIAGEITILTSRDLLTRVVKQIGPETIYPWIKNAENLSNLYFAVNTFEQSLRVERIGGSNMIQITFVHPDPLMAATALNTLVDLFKEKHIEVLSGEGSGAFLQNQQEVSRGKLRESERKLANYRQRYGVFSFEEQRQSLITQRTNLDTNLKTAQNEINALQQKIVFIKGSGWKTEPNREVKLNLLALEKKEKEMLSKYKENSVPVQNVRAEIHAAVKAMNQSTEEARQIELSKAEGELIVARAKYDGLRQQLSQIDDAMRSLDARSQDFAELKREVTSQEQSYQTYTKKLEDAQVGEEMDRHTMVAISVAEKAIPSSVPKQGRFGKKQLIFMGFFGGIAAGIILAFLLEQMAPGMTTPGNAERRLNLPVIAAIRRLILSPQLPIDENPKVDEAAAEMDMEQEMIALYQTITAVLPDSNRCSVLFVGSRSNEGTSTVARQLARVASLRMGKSVLLIDLDRSRPDLHVYSNLKPEGDSLNSLETGDQIEQSLRRVEESSLYVMPLFWKTITAPKTIDYAKRGSFWESLRERFDLIIVDSAPATMFPDGPAIVSRVDGVIFVVEAEKTRWQVAQSVKEKIINSGGNIIGVVFNKRRFYIPEFIYRYL